MRRALALATVLLSACGTYHGHSQFGGGDGGTGTTGDGGISFTLRDAGGESSSSSGSGSGSTSTGGTIGLSTSTGGTGSGSTSGTTGTPDAGHPDAGFVDNDGDGLDDRTEAQLVHDYLPFLSVSSQDGCTLSGIVYRARPHPADPNYVQLVLVQLFEKDCPQFGNAQVGDTEAIALTIDPRLPPPDGINYVTTLAHRGTSCSKTSSCSNHAPTGACAAVPTCDLGTVRGTERPVVYVSTGKHGVFASTGSCSLTCGDACTLSSAPALPPTENAGEPDAHLTDDLSDGGIITYAYGWTQAGLLHYDPWGDAGFGAGAPVELDLTDPALETPICP